jgi:hydrogenase expression/formation protein HypC
MKVTAVEPGFAQVYGRGETRRVSTLLTGACAPGQWLLVFLNDARELISTQRAAEVDATLDLLMAVMNPGGSLSGVEDPGFALPSAMDPQALRRLTQA